ncbi:hypothetical protein OG900_22085 [Streptomyces sp. NBC_00433]
MHPATASEGAGSQGHPAAAPAAAPVTTRAAALAQPGLGSDDLVQSDDFFQQGLSPVGATVDLTGAQGLSACSGEATIRTLTKGKAAAFADVTWAFDTSDTRLAESAAEGSTNTAAASYEKQLNAVVRDCQDEPEGHWYYGQGHAISVTGGKGTWYPTFNGDGSVAGGVAVIRGGHDVAIVELTGQPSDDPTYVADITAAALNRLAS